VWKKFTKIKNSDRLTIFSEIGWLDKIFVSTWNLELWRHYSISTRNCQADCQGNWLSRNFASSRPESRILYDIPHHSIVGFRTASIPHQYFSTVTRRAGGRAELHLARHAWSLPEKLGRMGTDVLGRSRSFAHVTQRMNLHSPLSKNDVKEKHIL
jgi:hypothetical protein